MQPQTTKKLFAFIILLFSISFLNAQSFCKENKVPISLYVIRHSGNTCSTTCVSQNQVARYLAQGWCTCNSSCWCGGPCNGTTQGKNKVSEKRESDKSINALIGFNKN
jgi:hypothetical protein